MTNKFWLRTSAFLFVFILIYGLYTKSQTLIPSSAKVFRKKTVVIDAGHGFPDNGAVSESGIYENEINLEIAKKLEKQLKKAGMTVIMTRKDSNSLSTSKTNNKREDLNKRVGIRDSSDADLFVSIHLNHFSDSRYSGAQVFYGSGNEESELAAGILQSNLIKLVDPNNKRTPMKSDGIYIIKNTKIPSVLVECGFLSNPNEAKLLNTSEYQKKLSSALYCGICEYLEK